MSEIKDNGGPAFPGVVTEFNRSTEEREITSTGGMTLRDYFAAKAMQSALSRFGGVSIAKEIAEEAYQHADAMLQARKS